MDNSYGLAELHEQLLIIMDDIDRVCRAHDIKYTISDGTLLGAVREKGFIPWDDDMDVRMEREEFEKFKTFYSSEKRDGFIIGHPCNLATYSVINPDYVIPNMIQKGESIVNPWVSIFPMDCAPNNNYISRLKAIKMKLLSGMMGKPPQYAVFPPKSQRMWNVTSSVGKLIGPQRVKKWFDSSCTSLNNKKSSVYASYTTNYKNAPYLRYPKDLFAKVEDMTFENRKYKGISRYDEYLRMTYGDNYMVPIKPEQRKLRHMEMS